MVFDVLVCLGGVRRGSGWWRGVTVSSRPIRRRNSHKKVHVIKNIPYMSFGKSFKVEYRPLISPIQLQRICTCMRVRTTPKPVTQTRRHLTNS